MSTSALVFASGKGTRMAPVTEKFNLPKHLLPLTTQGSETTLGRLISSLEGVADQIICTIESEDDLASFENALRPLSPNIEIVVKDPNQVEFGEVEQVTPMLKGETLIVTNGDLLFDDGVLENFISKNSGRNHVFRGREGNPENKSSYFDILNSRVSLIPVEILRRAFRQGSAKRKKLIIFTELVIKTALLGRTARIPTIANVDTPKDYELAKEFFSKKQHL